MSTILKSINVNDMIQNCRTNSKKRNFLQSFELYVLLKDIDIKKQDTIINEFIVLPNEFSIKQKLCIFASGDLALKSKKTDVDKLVEPDELNQIMENKRNARKLSNNFDMFLAEPSLMPAIGKSLGQFLGPKNKMPTPIPPNVEIADFIKRFKTVIRLKSTTKQLSISCKVGDDKMDDKQVIQNIDLVLSNIVKKLPSGINNIKTIIIKLSMGQPVKSKV